MIKIGGTEIVDIAIGSIPIEKAYIGSQLVWEKSAPLPEGAVQVEWLKTDGKAYINTGFTGKCEFIIKGGIDRTQTTSANIFGSRITTYNSSITIYWYGDNASSHAGEIRFDITAGGGTSSNTPNYIGHSIPNDSTISFIGTTFTAGGYTMTPKRASQNPNSGKNHYLFGLNANGSLSGVRDGTYISAAKFMQNGVTIRSYIPVRIGTVGYLYDKITKELYGNANSSGAFTYGNDVT